MVTVDALLSETDRDLAVDRSSVLEHKATLGGRNGFQFFFQGMADPPVGGDGIEKLHETAIGGTGSVDAVMHEFGAGGVGGSAAGQQVPAVADAAGATEMQENEQARRAAGAAWVAGDGSQTEIVVKGAVMVRGSLRQAQQLVALLGVEARWRDPIGDSQRGDFQFYKLSPRLREAAAAREAGGWLPGPQGEFLWRFDVANQERHKLEATDAPVRPPAVPRIRSGKSSSYQRVEESLVPSSAVSAYFGDGSERAHGGGVEGGHGGGQRTAGASP